MALDYLNLNIPGFENGKIGGSSPDKKIDYLNLNIPGFKNPNAPKKLFEGGTFSDILDTLSIPQYAITGALTPGISVGEAVKTKFTPSKALNIQNKAGAFITDLILDPLNFVGFAGATTKGLKAIKAGEEAVTLGGAALKGEKALFGLSLPFSSKISVPLVKGEGLLKGITQTAETVKKLPGIGKTLTALGAAPASGYSSIPDIEKAAKEFSGLKQSMRAASGSERQFVDEAVREASKLRDDYTKLLKAGRITESQLRDIVEYTVNPRSVALAPELASVAKSFGASVRKLNELYRKFGGTELEGKVLKNVLSPELVEASAKTKPFAGAIRAVGGNTGSEQFAKNVGLRDVKGKITAAFLEGKSGGKLADGTGVFKLTDGLYGTSAALQKITQAKAAAIYLNKDVQEAIATAIAALRKTNPESLFTRVALSPRQLNSAFEKAGTATRFSEDPAEILFAQGKDVARMRSRFQFTERLKGLGIGQPHTPGDPIPAGLAEVNIKGLENYLFPEALKPHLEKTYKSFSSIDDVNEFVKLYDKMQNTWKGFATYFNPAFHSRNSISNHWQLYLAGVSNPIAHVRGYRTELAIRKALRNNLPATTYVKPEYKKFVEEFMNSQGLRGTGAFTLDAPQDMATRLIDNPLGKLTGSVGETLENSSKLSLYIDRRLAGYTSNAAAADVRKYLFDYGDLTDFEKNVLKRIFPFYTWTRNNLPLQVAMLIQRPARISAIAKAKAAIESSQTGEPLDEKYMPEWLREAYPIYFGKDGNGLQRFIKLEGFLPTVDLNKLGRLKELPFENLSPLIKTPLELMTNYDFYYEKEISEYTGQKKPVAIPFTDSSVQVGAPVQKLLSMFRPLSELQKFSNDPTKNIQPTTAGQVLNFLLGKTYQLDITRQRQVYDYVKNKSINDIEADLENARKRHQPNEVTRLLQLLLEAKRGSNLKL